MQPTYSFALEAQKCINAGNADAAVHLCEQGLLVYPEYGTAYSVLARAYVLKGDITLALEAVKRGLFVLPANKGLQFLQNELEEQQRSQRNAPAESVESTVPEVTPLATPTVDEQLPTIEAHDASISIEEEQTHIQEVQQGELRESDYLHTTLEDDALSVPDDANDNWEEAAFVAEEVYQEQLLEVVDSNTSNTEAEPEAIVTGEQIVEIESAVGAVENVEANQQTEEVAEEAEEEPTFVYAHSSPMRVMELYKGHQSSRTLRSNNLRLIPGLEYTPLRFDTMRKRSRRVNYIPDPPPFPAIRGSKTTTPMMPNFAPAPPLPDLEQSLRQRMSDFSHESTTQSERKLTALEELALKLEKARIPAVAEESELPQAAQPAAVAPEPTMVSDTMASIYVRQGAFEQAIKAYQMLARLKPEKFEFYQEKIDEIKSMMEQ